MGEVIEIFGLRLKIVQDNDKGCSKCALKGFCYPKGYPMPCKDANGNVNRIFIKA
jgi:hypothetical protein